MNDEHSTPRKSWLSARQKLWIEIAALAGVVTMVVATYLETAGTSRGFLFGSAETTVAVALAVALIMPLIGFRIIERGKKQVGEKSVSLVMVGTALLCVGALPLPLVAAHLYHKAAVMEARLHGYGDAVRVGSIAEKRPEDVAKIANLVGLEVLHEALAPGFPVEWDKEMSDKVDARWKAIGFNGTPRQ